MRRPYVNQLFLLLLFLCPVQMAFTQEVSDPAVLKLDTTFTRYVAGMQQPDIFLHLDKTVYVTQENIWFTGYLLNDKLTEAQHTLHVLLVEEATQKICLSEKFVVNSGMTQGALFLPDSLPSGEYRLLAYTNSLLIHHSQPCYQQPISIRKTENTLFRLSLQPLTPAQLNSDSIAITYKVLTGYSGLASGGTMQYTLLADGKKIRTGKQKVSPFGEVVLPVARQEVWQKKVRLQATVFRQKDTQLLKTEVPLFEQTAIMKCYPESGNLVEGHPNSMAIEIRNGAGIPIAANGALRANGIIVASFVTDQYGMGVIHWMPEGKWKYTITLDDPGLQLSYQLPSIAKEGFSIRVVNAVVVDSNVLVELRAPDSGTCFLVMHNYRRSFFSGKLLLPRKEVRLQLPVEDIPDGVTTITLLDAAGIPRAERAIYINRQPSLHVAVTTDSTVYQHRSKLQVKVKVTDQKGQPVPGLFSMACVLSSRIDSSRAGDISRFVYFDRFLPRQAALPPPSYFTNAHAVNQILLTRFWTRYKWEEISAAQSSPHAEDKDCHAGYVFYKDRKVKKPVQLMLLAQKTYSLTTDSTGYFTLPDEALRLEDGKKAVLLVADKENFKDYSVKLFDQCTPTDTMLATATYPEPGTRKAELSVQEQQLLKGSMATVVVTARRHNNWESGVFKSTTCNDWVCMFNILNCPNHPTGSVPQEGGMYRYKGREVEYHGCKGAEQIPTFMQHVKGVNYPKEFYVADYDKFNPTEPETMTTVFWNYLTITDKNGEAVIRFSTNDLSGRFTCILQGYTTQGVISGKAVYNVK